MADLLGTDEFLVNRNDVTYTQEQETLMATLQDNDHLLINRAGQTYKITGSDLINSVVDPLEVTVVLAPTDGYTDTEVTAVPVVSGGKQPDGGYIFSYQWVTADDINGTNKANIAGATDATFTPDNAQVNKYLGCVVSTTDALGTFAEGESYIGPIQILAQAPVIADVVVTEIYDGQNRFTDKEFPYVTTMAVAGEPAPTYEVKAKLSGTTFDFDVLSDVITDVEGGGISTCETDTIQSITTQTATTYVYKYGAPQGATIAEAEAINWDDGTDVEIRPIGQGPLDSRTPSVLLYEVGELSVWGVDSAPGTDKITSIWESDDGNNWEYKGIYSQYDLSVNDGRGYVSTKNYLKVHGAGGFTVSRWFVYDAKDAYVLEFPSTNGFDCFEPGDVVQGDDANQDAVWSQQASSEANLQPNSKAFDGNVDTFNQVAFSDGDSNIVFTLTPVPSGEVVEIKTQQEKEAGAIECNGLSITDNTNTPVITQCGRTTSSTLTIKQNINSGQASQDVSKIFYVKVGDQLLVDQGVAVDNAKVISKDEDANTITVDGGTWTTSDKLVKETPYDTKLTVASSENLELLTGDVFMSDGSTPFSQTSYKLVTTDIESVDQATEPVDDSENWSLTFSGQGGLGATWPAANAFDGDPVSYAAGPANGEIIWDCSGYNIVASKVTCIHNNQLKVITGSGTFTSSDTDTPEARTNEITFPEGEITSISVVSTNSSWGTSLNQVKIDDVLYVDTDSGYVPQTTGNKLLTFPGDVSSNPDLRYFLPGDVVQSNTPFDMGGGTATVDKPLKVGVGAGAGTSADPNVVMDGEIDIEHAICVEAANLPVNITCSPTIPVPGGRLVTIYYLYGNSANTVSSDSKPILYSVNGNVVNLTGSSPIINPNVNGGAGAPYSVIKFPTDYGDVTNFVVRFVDTGTGNPVLFGFTPEADTSADVKVVSTGYPTSNSMVVDGGNWDTAANQDKVWSDGFTGDINPSNPGTNAFDGDLNTYCASVNQGATQTLLLGEELSGTLDFYNVTMTGKVITKNGSTVIHEQDLNAGSTGWENIVTNAAPFDRIVVESAIDSIIAWSAFRINGRVLVDAGVNTPGESHVEYQTNGGEGSVVKADLANSTLMVTNSGDDDNRWIAGNYGEGSGTSTDFYITPADAVAISQDYAWGKLQIVNNKAQVTGIQKDDPGFLPVPAKDYSIKFPAVFPTGNEPDDDLPRGTCVAAIVAAENSEGRSVKESNCFMPADVNPEGAAGPITDSTPTQLTVASNANLGEFSPGDNLVMVDENSEISNYTMQTSEIVSVDDNVIFDGTVTGTVGGRAWSTSPSYGSHNPGYLGAFSGVIDNAYNAAVAGGGDSDLSTFTFGWEIPVAAGDKYRIGLDNRSTGNYIDFVFSGGDTVRLVKNTSGLTNLGGYLYEYDASAYAGQTLVSMTSKNSGGYFAGIVGIQSNGEWLTSGESIGNLLLTFADTNPDLKFFRPGDVVQGTSPNSVVTTDSPAGFRSDRPQANILDGNKTTRCDLASSNSGDYQYGIFVDIESLLGSNYTGQLSIYTNYNTAAADSDRYKFYVVYDDGSESSKVNFNTGGGWKTVVSNGSNGAKPIKYIVATAVDGRTPGLWTAISVSNSDSGIITGDPEVKVVDTDLVNNTITVDGGQWDYSLKTQVWSDDVGGNSTNGPLAFNGDLTNGSDSAPNVYGIIDTSDWGFADTTVEVYIFQNGEVLVNDNAVALTGASELGWASIGVVGDLQSIKWKHPSQSYTLRAVKVGGRLLVDQGVTGLGDTEVTYGPVTGTGTFQVADQVNNTMTIQNSNDRWIDNTNRLGIDFYVRDNITVLNADNPKHVAMQQAIADAFAAFPQKVNERRTSIASSFYRLMSGETLTAGEYELLEDTVLDAVNAVEPFALNGFYPLYYTSAKADAASSAGTHHSHTINGVEYYMPDGGTIYHGNYIAPGTSTTDNNDSSY